MYFIFDIEGQLINLSNKDIYFWSYGTSGKFEAAVKAAGLSQGDYDAEYILHQGTMAECRDFMSKLGGQLLAERIEVSSTPNQPTPPVKSSDDDLPF